MNNLLCILFLLILSNQCYSQNIRYFSHYGIEILDSVEYSYKKQYFYNDSIQLYEELTHRLDGSISRRKTFKDKEFKIQHGQELVWYTNGKLKRSIDYKNNLQNGSHFTYWNTGQLRRSEIYIRGEFIAGKCYNIEEEEVEFFEFEELPTFPGGLGNMLEFIDKKIVYPELARVNNIEGIVVVRFLVSEQGNIDYLEVAKSVHKLLDKEALRVIKKMPKWNPGKHDGETINVYFNLPITFKLK